MQTVAGKPARGITRAEFIDFMNEATKAFYRKLSIPANHQRWDEQLGTDLEEDWLGWNPIFSYDNPPAHGGVTGKKVMEALDLQAADHFELPPNSCDIHRVIEHTHARLVAAFNDWLYRDPSEVFTMSDYKQKLEELFYKHPPVASPEVIMADVQDLPKLFQEVIEKKGGWASKAFR